MVKRYNKMNLRILFLEPFYGGSHKDFVDGLTAASRHSIDLHTLPARFWKWRMRGAALHFTDLLPDPAGYDLVFTSDMLSVSDLKSLWGKKSPPVIIYFHESQLSYPAPKGEERDYHFCFTDITNCLASDRVLFNSHFHKDSFFKELPLFLQKMPEYKPYWAVDKIAEKSEVLYPGCNFSTFDSNGKEKKTSPVDFKSEKHTDRSPLILWNHRWEFDKQPDVFFDVLYEADSRGVDFRIALAGENFQMVPKAFLQGQEYFKDRVVQYGFIDSKQEYFNLLFNSDIIISTAIQENFGISVLEGIYAGSYPLLPDRLAYPEIIPREFHRDCLYDSEDELIDKLIKIIQEGIDQPRGLADAIGKFDWNIRIKEYDNMFSKAYAELE